MTDKLRYATQQAERAAFEAWISKSLGHPFRPRLETLAWNSWQARAALAQQDEHCDNCKGSGAVVDMIYPTSDPQDAFRAEVPCDECDGTGMVAGSQAHFKCPKCSDTEQQDAQAVPSDLVDKLRKFRGLPPHNNPSNVCQGDGYFYASIEAQYTSDQIAAANGVLNAAPTPPAQQDAQAVPQGYNLVPVQPTPEMIYAAQVEGNAHTADEIVDDYRAMLNAAPTPPAQRVMLTPDEIDLIDSGMCGEREFSHNYAHAIIEAYERKNGIK